MPDPLITLLVGTLLIGLGVGLFWPKGGLIGHWRRVQRLSERVLIEDALKYIHKAQVKGQRPTMESVAGTLQVSMDQTADLLSGMERRGLADLKKGEIHLTPAGRDYALQVIRAHRLWERFLAEKTGYSEAEWHGRADWYEHRLSDKDLDALASQLGHPTHDPHGDPIPTADGDMVPHGGQPLTTLTLDQPGRIVHIEDEPEAVHAQLLAEGLRPGMEVRLTEVSSQRVRFWSDGDEHLLAPIVAANVSVVPCPQEVMPERKNGDALNSLKPGEAGKVVGISPRCRGPERRRLMDLGILPGTVIEAEMTSPGGDPTAYRIRGAMIALREEQAELINIEPLQENAS